MRSDWVLGLYLLEFGRMKGGDLIETSRTMKGPDLVVVERMFPAMGEPRPEGTASE